MIVFYLVGVFLIICLVISMLYYVIGKHFYVFNLRSKYNYENKIHEEITGNSFEELVTEIFKNAKKRNKNVS